MEHNYFDPEGNPISLEEWAERTATLAQRILRDDEVTLPGDKPATLRTVYLGFVEPSVMARLFGTAILTGPDPDSRVIVELEQHDSEEDAFLRHMAHLEAIHAGHHCRLCQDGQQHEDG